MLAPNATEQFAALEHQEDADTYNYEHFRITHILADGAATVAMRGIHPGEVAPDFTLPHADGSGLLTLSHLRDKPVLLRFGSTT